MHPRSLWIEDEHGVALGAEEISCLNWSSSFRLRLLRVTRETIPRDLLGAICPTAQEAGTKNYDKGNCRQKGYIMIPGSI